MRNWIIGGLIAAIGITATVLAVGSPYEREYGWRSPYDRGYEREYGWRNPYDRGYEREYRWRGPYDYRIVRSRQDVAPVQSEAYKEECGGCHFAYQPGLLPAASWQRIMDGLEDHFGENAELDQETTDQLRAYLIANAADRVDTGRSPGIANSLQDSAPLRFTETTYFRRQHHEIPERAVKGNPEVGSFSRCDACHTGAATGSYDEHGVRIPGFGRWEDD